MSTTTHSWISSCHIQAQRIYSIYKIQTEVWTTARAFTHLAALLLVISFGASSQSLALANLTIGDVQLSMPAVRPGFGIRVFWEVANTSTDSTAQGTWRDTVYLSKDNVSGDDLTLFEYGYFTIIPSGEHLALDFSVSIPTDTTLGEYWIVVKTDANDDFSESDEDDNTVIVGPLKVTQPNLIVKTISISNTPAGPNDRFHVTYQVQNASDDVGVTGTWADEVWLSYEKTGPLQRRLDRYSLWTDLEPGDDYQRTLGIMIPPDVWAGRYWIVVTTDVDNKTAETNEFDNSKRIGPFELAGDPMPAFPLLWWPLPIILASVGWYVISASTRKTDTTN